MQQYTVDLQSETQVISPKKYENVYPCSFGSIHKAMKITVSKIVSPFLLLAIEFVVNRIKNVQTMTTVIKKPRELELLGFNMAKKIKAQNLYKVDSKSVLTKNQKNPINGR